jgi:hypothetical protein
MKVAAAQAIVMRTESKFPLREVVVLLYAGTAIGCQRPLAPPLTSGSRLILVIDDPSPLLPEVAAALAPVTDTARITLTVTRITPDTIIGTHTGDLAHFPIQVSDDPTAIAPFLALRSDKTHWKIDGSGHSATKQGRPVERVAREES